jgi:hypothetical protein
VVDGSFKKNLLKLVGQEAEDKSIFDENGFGSIWVTLSRFAAKSVGGWDYSRAELFPKIY